MDLSKIDLFMEKLPKNGFPACELSITKDGENIFRKSVGFSDSAKTKPASNKDIYWIFSASKVITCIAAMRLVEAGLIGLDDPVSKYIPEYANMNILNKDGSLTPAKNPMTILHLFTMTGGMNYDIKSKSILESADKTTLGLVRAMAKEPLSFEPGSHYKYSLCHDVLAAVVEVVSGMRYSEYLEKNIFKPLGIKDMGFRPTEEQKKRFSALYKYSNGTKTAKECPIHCAYTLSDEYDSGGAGLFSTVDEYMKIITVVACGGTTKDGYQLLKPETIESMGINRMCDDALNDFASSRFFGYGWGLCGRAHMDPEYSLSKSPVGEFGWDGAACAYVMIDPKNRIAMYFGTHIHNCGYGYHKVHPTLRDLLYEALEEEDKN